MYSALKGLRSLLATKMLPHYSGMHLTLTLWWFLLTLLLLLWLLLL